MLETAGAGCKACVIVEIHHLPRRGRESNQGGASARRSRLRPTFRDLFTVSMPCVKAVFVG